ncbi:esterase/lipase, putative [Candida dubliniensis CD36]|uniref:Esterase/lipase, putative n=1 Tax=Candida dubliniensis (strain CD36 / ATCC MYA-646 / CBS 7987 / NCPF 3949 / NRRL Y-17841) TaxID=573826 RepID=B9WA64_CANDC|nr:esterase/lipase, putative [Candida dubliniensis CD36]CAX43283.1 esterase/lipase, putative [Candida dubliniensis CD36]
MITIDFFLKLVTLPYTVTKTVLQYYTVGTVYSRTNREFQGSLWKNVLLSVQYHVSGNYKKQNIKAVVYQPIERVIAKFKKHPLALALNHFGEKFDEYSFWIHKSEDPNAKVLIYIHGGGYLLNMFESQFVFVAALHYALDDRAAEKTSILVVDYSLTMFDSVYPTQLYEHLVTYHNLVAQGYKEIMLLGDSAGAHMSLSLARAIAYPEEVEDQLARHGFKVGFSVGDLPQPETLILVSPWVQPCTEPKLPPRHGCDVWGDLGAQDTTMGELYAGDNDKSVINNFLTFTNTTWAEHWKEVAALNNGNTLMIVGEREVLRDGVDDFYEIIKGSVEYYTEPGGIHAGLVYVESLDYVSKHGAQRAIEGDFTDKFAYNLVAKFINERV